MNDRLGVLLFLVLSSALSAGDLPLRVDNSRSAYFPPIVRQTYESCAQQVGIYAMMTFALNRARGTSARRPENQLAPLFAWNFLNLGRNRGAELVEGWQLAQAMGAPSLTDVQLDLGEWPHGYSTYLKAMQNRVRSYEFFPVTTEEGLQRAKSWLNQANKPNRSGGLLAIEGRLQDVNIVTIPKGQHEAGKTLVVHWGRGQAPGHLMTYVGYDDTVGYDLDGDGTLTNDKDINGDGFVTLADWERGAFIAANSFGVEWGDQGKCYVLYREGSVTPFRRGQWAATVDVWPNYHPQLTLKLEFATSDRSGIHVSVNTPGSKEPHTPLIFAHGKAALKRPKSLPLSPEKYSGYLHGKSRLGSEPARTLQGQSAAIEMGFDLTGRLPLRSPAYQLIVEKNAPEVQVSVIAASVLHYLPNGQLIDEQEFKGAPSSVGRHPLILITR